MLAALHHINDDEDPAGITAELRRALPPGSYLAISHFRDVSIMFPDLAPVTAPHQRYLSPQHPLPRHDRGSSYSTTCT
jgi:S-adenosyl methyltransferase